MTDRLKKLRDACTDKQQRFVQLYKNGQDRGEAYVNAGYHSMSKKIAQQCACKLLTKSKAVMAYFEALKDEDSRNTNITRTTQLNRLDTLYSMAVEQHNVSAGASVIREQNEMLGYHRENAPNMEREQARKELEKDEAEALDRLAQERTEEISQGGLKLAKGA